MVKPPSPDSETTCRSGNAAWAPIACAIALAIEPCQNEPISRRLPFMARYRAAQTVGRPTSQVKIASSDASRLMLWATCCGCSVPPWLAGCEIVEALGALRDNAPCRR